LASDPNQPCHQPQAPPASKARIKTPANRSRTARRKTFLAMKKKIARATTAIREIAAYVNVDSISNIVRWLQLLRLLAAYCSLLLITRTHHRLNIAANVEVAFNLDTQRVTGAHKVFEDHVDYMLVKDFYVAK
jgi:hypothetical protein